MSNNTPNYENNLVFPPASAIERCEMLEKKLEIAVKALEVYMTFCRHPAQEALAKIKELDK